MDNVIDHCVFVQTGKDDYANARNEAALKDTSYMPVATAEAEVRVLAGFMHAIEVVEAEKWAEALTDDSDALDDKTARMVALLAPKLSAVDSAKAFVEEIKEDFADLVKHCFVEGELGCIGSALIDCA